MRGDELPLREEDIDVLVEISHGKDLQEITSTTVYDNGQVNHCFRKLEELDLIQVDRPDGYTTRSVNGQKRTFRTPKRGTLTNKGEEVVSDLERDRERYESWSREELVREVQELKQQLNEFETRFQTFKEQVRTRFNEERD
ncbi:hypothetical protein [Halopiger aswanensis]|uniref:Transcriptional regulator n=1 Tax=Halopiger aswanensis TaxID=148449 RepID=A0A3R7DZY3_9EURY|nr:hypothetical protein [Halopiger aswanensis]RKD95639.1 hypothetical protein ATJ93_2500 [Halopiger aswanensis]